MESSKLQTINLTNNDLVKDHLRHLVSVSSYLRHYAFDYMYYVFPVLSLVIIDLHNCGNPLFKAKRSCTAHLRLIPTSQVPYPLGLWVIGPDEMCG